MGWRRRCLYKRKQRPSNPSKDAVFAVDSSTMISFHPIVRRAVLLIGGLCCFCSLSFGQTWTDPLPVKNAGGLFVQWRLYGLDTKSQKNAYEWVFENSTDSTILFDYTIATNDNEKRMGRITLGPRKRRFSGWVFDGDRIVEITAGRVSFQKGG